VFFDDTIEETPDLIEKNLPVISDNDKCVVCDEVFEKFFDETEDCWMLRGVIKIKEKVFWVLI
jgi:hypothetical protein